jgi:heptosyltransferase-2
MIKDTIKSAVEFISKKYRCFTFNLKRVNNVLINMVSPSNGLGDLVQATSLVRDIKKACPEVTVYILLNDSPKNDIVKFFPMPLGLIIAEFKNDMLELSPEFIVKRIKPMGFDLVLHGYLESWTDCNALVKHGRIRHSLGFIRNSGGKIMSMNTFSAQFNSPSPQPFSYHSDLISYLGLTEASKAKLYVPQNIETEIKRMLQEEYGIFSNDILLGVHPGCNKNGKAKRWFPERFIDVINRFCRISKIHKVLIISGPDESEVGREIAKSIASNQAMLVTGHKLHITAGIINKCTVFLTNDSGLMHIALAFNIPTVAVFGPTESFPYRKFYMSFYPIQSNYNRICKPCYATQRYMECIHQSNINPPCLDEISTDDVFDAIEENIRKNDAMLNRQVEFYAEKNLKG